MLNALASARQGSIPQTPSIHRLRLGLPGYLIPFAPLAFALQRQCQPSNPPSPQVFHSISTHFTATPRIPVAPTTHKPHRNKKPFRVKPGDFTTDLRWPPTRPLR